MKILVILSHGEATEEQGFSVNKSLEVENLKEDSYIAHRLIFEKVNNSNDVHSTNVTKEMRRFVSSSRQKYILHLEEQLKIENQKNSENSRKRKVELNRLKSKKTCLQADITAMENSAEKLSSKAEFSKNITLFIKANALQRDIKEKISEIKELVGI
ncbi:hypothetical protein AVEN_165255-1 [Araneus ventricosus]|uniref:Uncharacterized protein n=1 Tax=Araneus ventricosus TaxID=182803 RepID=A0A4Y2AUR1_ARAVE|nr:hypothetical protein AVEN_165255-1 [Araneus ventricosus]